MEHIITIAAAIIAVETTYLTVASFRQRQVKSKEPRIFIDTSVLIDGRIVSLAESGFLTARLAIPRSVVGELQFLADNSDSEKRMRARHGLDVVATLQATDRVNVEIFQDARTTEDGVDNRLLALAKKYNGYICTVDYNLNKVAKVENIPVVNINELAGQLRVVYLPGEIIPLSITQKGQERGQAVGHLPDGTMVVVEDGAAHIGKTMDVECIRALQTAAGKMLFARVKKQNVVSSDAKKQRSGGRKEQQGNRAAVVAKDRKAQKPTTPAKTQRRRPASAASREDALLDLVNSQDS